MRSTVPPLGQVRPEARASSALRVRSVQQAFECRDHVRVRRLLSSHLTCEKRPWPNRSSLGDSELACRGVQHGHDGIACGEPTIKAAAGERSGQAEARARA